MPSNYLEVHICNIDVGRMQEKSPKKYGVLGFQLEQMVGSIGPRLGYVHVQLSSVHHVHVYHVHVHGVLVHYVPHCSIPKMIQFKAISQKFN